MFSRTFYNRSDAHTDVTSPTRFPTARFTSIPFPVFSDQLREGGFDLDYTDFDFLEVAVALDMVSEGHTITFTHCGQSITHPIDAATAVDVLRAIAFYQGTLQNR